MFGLEKATEKDRAEEDKELYELEVRIREVVERRKLHNHLKQQIQTLKAALRKGGEQEDYDNLGLLLSAYTSIEKLTERVQRSFERAKKGR